VVASTELKLPELSGLAKGRVPLHTLRADVDYSYRTAQTTYGVLGVKVWIFKGEVIPGQEKIASCGYQLNPGVVSPGVASSLKIGRTSPRDIQ
jgi:ribosomal protein S3